MQDKNATHRPRRWLAWLLVGLVAFVIFCFSAQPNSAEFTQEIFGDWNGTARQLAHMIEFAALFLVLRWALSKSLPRAGWLIVYLLALTGCGAYALFDEWHQLFVPGRTSSLVHVANDMIGAGIASGVSLVVRLFRRLWS